MATAPEFSPAARALLERALQEIPAMLRAMARGRVETAALDEATTRADSAVSTQDVIRAVLRVAPPNLKTKVIAGLQRAGIDLGTHQDLL